MDSNSINSLIEALKFSPDNFPLRLLLANTYLHLSQLDEAEAEYLILKNQNFNEEVKLGLAKVYFQKGNFYACHLILSESYERNTKDQELLLLLTRALVNDEEFAQALPVYQRILELNPSFKDEALDNLFRIKGTPSDENEEEDSIFLEKPKETFADVGGMDQLKTEIDLKIIKPIEHQELYKAYGKKAGGGILMYGPPGCGKTFIAKATAGQINAKFISVGLNEILDMWIGNSEKNLHELFEVARKNKPCVIFIDEIDALGASRSDMRQSAMRPLINHFLAELDGVEYDNEGVLILGATNAPWSLDSAFRRPGRFDRILFVPPPDVASREVIFRLKLEGKPCGVIDFKSLASKTDHFSGADITAVVDLAIESKLQQAFLDGIPKPLETKDLQNAIGRHKASTQEWFVTAKNYAMFANESGLYDDILKYLKIKI